MKKKLNFNNVLKKTSEILFTEIKIFNIKFKFLRKTPFTVLVFMVINVFFGNLFFNSAVQKKVPSFYPILLKNTGIKNFGYLGLLGKKVNSSDGVVALTSLVWIKQILKQTIAKLVFLNIGILLLSLLFKKKKKNTSQGTAKWGGLEVIDYSSEKDKIFGMSLKANEGVVLGRFKGITLRDNAKTHVCVTAPTRTGKGVSIIIPTLIDSWSHSVLVLDIKGENYQLTSGARKEKFNNLVLRFAPKSENSCGYNPLSEVRLMQYQETEDVKLIADIICAGEKPKGGGGDDFFDIAASETFFSICFYVLYRNFLQRPKFVYEDGEKKPVSDASIIDVVNFIADPKREGTLEDEMKRIAKDESLIDKYGIDEETKKYVRERLKEIYIDADSDIVDQGNHPKFARGFSEKGNLPPETFNSVIGTLKTKLTVFDMQIVAKNTSKSDFRIFDLMNWERPVSLYLVIPPADIVVLAPLIKMLIVQIVNLLTPEIDYTNQSGHLWRMLFLLDEFPAIGKMEAINKGIGYFAGYGMKLMVILQSLDQLYEKYGKENAILSNCSAQIFYTANDETTANYVSKLLGKETIEQYTQSNKSATTLVSTKSQSFIGRSLLEPDEVMRFPSDKIIVRISGKNPIKADKIVYFKEKQYADLTKIPYIYSESCYDITKQYIKLTEAQKLKYSDYPYNYVPYPGALNSMKRDLNKMNHIIKSTTDEMVANMIPENQERFRRLKENYKKQAAGYKKYVKIFNELAVTDERFRVINISPKTAVRNAADERERTNTIKVVKEQSELDKTLNKISEGQLNEPVIRLTKEKEETEEIQNNNLNLELEKNDEADVSENVEINDIDTELTTEITSGVGELSEAPFEEVFNSDDGLEEENMEVEL